ncbi:MAG: outer membrane beta-barrel domain-containing protein [Myxococcaceae bacterium]
MSASRLIAALALALAASPALAQIEPEPSSTAAIQERAYVMMHEVDATVGFLPTDPYTKGLTVGGSYIAHFSDFIAWEVARGGYTFGLPTSLRSQLERDFGFLPTAFDTPQFFAGSDLLIKPFYGKLAVANKWVVHAELFFAIGGTFFKYSAPGDFRLGPTVGVFARIFLNKVFSIRFGMDDHVQISFRDAKPTNAIALTFAIGLNIGASE